MSNEVSRAADSGAAGKPGGSRWALAAGIGLALVVLAGVILASVLHLRQHLDRKSTRLNSSHLGISYAVFCLKKKLTHEMRQRRPYGQRAFLHAVVAIGGV